MQFAKHRMDWRLSDKLNEAEKQYLHELERQILTENDVYAKEKWATFFAYDHPEAATKEIAAKAVSYYEEAVEAGVSRAMLNLGAVYYNGVLVEQDFEKALELYHMAESSEDAEVAARAVCNLGYCYYYGRSVSVDKETAFRFFLKGSLRYDDANCLYKLGDMYRYGDHVEKDEDMAYTLYERALEEGRFRSGCCADIYKRVGECKLYGVGTRGDAIAAARYLAQAKCDLYERIYVKNDPFAPALFDKVEELLWEAEQRLEERHDID